MPQNSNSNHTAGGFDGYTSRPMQIAQGGQPKQLTTGETAAEEKPAPLGTVPNAELLFFNTLVVFALLVTFAVAARQSLKRIPKGFSNFAEFVGEALNRFTVEIIGPEGHKYTPLVGTIFLYILVSNLLGLIPSFHSPTSNVSFTLALGLSVWVYVQFVSIRDNRVSGWIMHFAGPKISKFRVEALLLMPLEIISDVFRPFTLAIRLFGNIFGEDVILFALAGFGAASAATRWIPLQLPIMFLALLTDLVQSMVFTTLVCIYIALVTHHGDDHGGHTGEQHADLLPATAPHATQSS